MTRLDLHERGPALPPTSMATAFSCFTCVSLPGSALAALALFLPAALPQGPGGNPNVPQDRLRYVQQIAAAHEALESHEYAQAENFLNACQVNLRGWEHRFLTGI